MFIEYIEAAYLNDDIDEIRILFTMFKDKQKAHELDWFKPWDKVSDWNYPYAKWFTNAKLNITANCLDRHVNNHRRNKVALI